MEEFMSEIDFNNLEFEDALVQLETIVRELEAGRIKLDDAVEAYEKATALKQFCEDKLKNAELKIEKINVASNGDITTEPLDKIEE
jgi:exodeoxyribonuclease VII small subunit